MIVGTQTSCESMFKLEIPLYSDEFHVISWFSQLWNINNNTVSKTSIHFMITVSQCSHCNLQLPWRQQGLYKLFFFITLRRGIRRHFIGYGEAELIEQSRGPSVRCDGTSWFLLPGITEERWQLSSFHVTGLPGWEFELPAFWFAGKHATLSYPHTCFIPVSKFNTFWASSPALSRHLFASPDSFHSTKQDELQI